MKKIILPLVLLLVSLVLVPAAQAKLTASVDRNQLALDETLNLTLTKDGGSAFSSADLTPLKKDFRILGRSQSSSTSFVNGSMSSSFSLELTLSPKRSGILTIPALTVGGDASQPLTVKVLTMARPKTKADSAPIFLESEAEPKEVKVQQQVVLTLRIYWAVQAKIVQPETPQIPDALVKKLNDATYSKTVNGRTYQVFERKYAVFPQKSGSLTIPPLTVHAVVPSQSRSMDQFHNFFPDFFADQGREIVLRSNPARIEVGEKSSGYPGGAVWLPSGKLTAVMDWSREPGNLKVGDSTTLTISLAGQGLLASQLPPVDLPDLPGIKSYQSKPELKDLKNSDGVTGLRKESIALIPTRSGTVELPEIRIPWWNTAENKIEQVVLPARKLVIKGTTGEHTQGGTMAATIPPAPTSAGGSAHASQATPAAFVPASASASGPSPLSRFSGRWQMAAAVLGLAWLFTLLLLLKSRRQLRSVVKDRERGDEAGALRRREAFKILARACRNNDPRRARTALLAWARELHPDEKVGTGADLTRLFPGAGLKERLAEIDRVLYGRGEGAEVWQGGELLASARRAEKIKGGGKEKNLPLPPLYR